MEFLQAYQYLDMICRNMLGNDRGVVAYIEQMRAISDGAAVVEGWHEDLMRLRDCNMLRNKLAHGYPKDVEPQRLPEAAQWIGAFAGRIISGTDPLAVYKKTQ